MGPHNLVSIGGNNRLTHNSQVPGKEERGPLNQGQVYREIRGDPDVHIESVIVYSSFQ